MSTSDDSFFSRWSRRKTQVRSGQPLPAEPVPAPATAPVVAPVAAPDGAMAGTPAAAVPPPADAAGARQPAEPSQPLVTLEDVAKLTPDSDFSAFVARGVPSSVRNAAVKKLFADPRFNVMDGLDIYIDDYSRPSPLAAADMARMVGAQFLKLVDDPNQPAAPKAAEAATGNTTASAAAAPAKPEALASSPTEPANAAGHRDPVAPPPQPHDDHADLQLQPDDAPGPEGPGQRPG
ncbi:MAG: DUF3306 domain-containing protein [Hydrogenophaga sp.]|jgi:hypothetical protein|nr:DUF3306 domain-containing protein [Hydrogenophaga sp.]